MAFYRVLAGGSVMHRRLPADLDQRRPPWPSNVSPTCPGQQTFDAVADELGPPPGVQPGVGVSGERATRSLRVASRAVSICSVRATWLTHAEISVSAGRMERSEVVTAVAAGGGAAARPASTTATELVADAPATVPLVDAAALGELVEGVVG